jgi:GAF domain-containing protein
VLFAHDGSLQVATARTRGGAVILDATDQVSRSILQQVRASQTPVLVDDALSDRVLAGAGSVLSLGLRSVMCVPLVSQGQAVGAIYVENRSARGRFCEDDLVPLALFANQVVVALANARLYEALEAAVAERTRELQEANALLARQAEELREQSIRDSLTGLHNRRYFTELLPALFEQARQGRGSLALACADIDHFKQINDTFLHSCGPRRCASSGCWPTGATSSSGPVRSARRCWPSPHPSPTRSSTPESSTTWR